MRDFSADRLHTDLVEDEIVLGNERGVWLVVVRRVWAVSEDDTRRLADQLAARWNAVAAALAEYDDPHKSITSETAHRMADILRTALGSES